MSAATSIELREVVVLGAGTMGQGIAQVAAAAGSVTRVYDVDGARVAHALAAIQERTERLVQRGKLDRDARRRLVESLVPSTELGEACARADLVIEAAPEDMALKVELFAKVKDAAPAHALLASNTSSLSITELGTRIGAPERVVGLHFFNPPPVMELVEIVRGLGTSAATIDACVLIAARFGKTPIVVRDAPGFATSRLGVAIGAEAMRMLEAGVASAADIDRAMELGYRHPMGPLKLTDLVGLDVRLAILEHLHRELGEQFRPPSILRQMVRAGRLGKKTGLGFYRWTDAGPEPAAP